MKRGTLNPVRGNCDDIDEDECRLEVSERLSLRVKQHCKSPPESAVCCLGRDHTLSIVVEDDGKQQSCACTTNRVDVHGTVVQYSCYERKMISKLAWTCMA